MTRRARSGPLARPVWDRSSVFPTIATVVPLFLRSRAKAARLVSTSLSRSGRSYRPSAARASPSRLHALLRQVARYRKHVAADLRTAIAVRSGRVRQIFDPASDRRMNVILEPRGPHGLTIGHGDAA